jgi:hypothetical protein
MWSAILGWLLGRPTQYPAPSPKQLHQWLEQCEEICTAGVAQTQELARKQVRLRDVQVASLLLQQAGILPATATELQKRIDDLRSERRSWESFASAHVDFLTKGKSLIATAPRHDNAMYLECAYQNIAAAIVYVKNIFIFTFSMRSKTRSSILKRCRSCIGDAETFLHALAPKLSVEQIQQQSILYWTLRASAFDLIPQILQRQHLPPSSPRSASSPSPSASPAIELDLNQLDDNCDTYAGELHRLAAIPAHLLDYRSLLEFIPLGLDPTLVAHSAQAAAEEKDSENKKEEEKQSEGKPAQTDPTINCETDGPASMKVVEQSAIQLARQYERRWLLKSSTPDSESDQLTRANVSKLLSTPPACANVLRSFVAWPAREHRDTDYFMASSQEDRRRKELHFAFLLDLAGRWREHSGKVRKMLLQTSPGNFIPDLVNITAEYLDLEPESAKGGRGRKEQAEAEKLKLPRAIQMQ